MRALFFAFFLFSFSLFAGAAPTKKPSMAEELKRKTVALVQADEEQTRPYCTGVWISTNRIATAAHCVEDLAVGDYTDFVMESDLYESGSIAPREHPHTWRAKVALVNPKTDVAVLESTFSPPHGIAELSADLPGAGEQAQTVGHIKGFWYSYSSGYVSGMRVWEGITVVQATTPIGPGNSGGGLFDSKGKLIGICSRGNALYSINLFISTKHLQELIK